MTEEQIQNLPKEGRPVFYVGIGASAGGLEALDALFSHMPADSGMAFIVIQHLSPDYKSLMVELLSKKTEMPVMRAENGMLISADTVYLIPPRKNLTVFHGKLLLSDPDHARGINLPIDIFLRSLADDIADRTIAIILSGTGSDGVRGIRAIKEAGGMVMVQSEESAKFDGMPRAAISTGLADFVLAPDEMPQRLLSCVRHPYGARPDRPQAILTDEDGMTRIFTLLRERSKVDFTFYKPTTVVRRLERRMTVNQFDILRDYVRFIENNPAEVMALYRELLIGVTSFFRDREVFDELEERFLPELFRRKENREIRFWVAGCSTGEEAYTLAILSLECMERAGRKHDLKIFATDIDRDAVIQAGNGVYPESISADISQSLLTKYFQKRGDRYQIDRMVREMVVFAQHNLVKDPPFTNIDLVSCRNLLIYLQPVLQRKVMEFFNFSLNPEGILLFGTSETTGDMAEYFETMHQKFRIYRSCGKKRAALADAAFPLSVDKRPLPKKYGIAANAATHPVRQEDERLLERFLQALSGDYVPFAVVVNGQMEVQHILGDSEGYLMFPSGRLMNDITKMVPRELAIPLATGIQKVFHSKESLKYTNIRLRHKEGIKLIQLYIKLLPVKRGQAPFAVVFLQETTGQPRDHAPADAKVYDVNMDAEQRIQDLEQELQFNRENLQATIEELETSNEELQATNEELLASNEELQSTNEELQSVNEELHTVNAEYQSKIIELTQLNNDLDNLMAGTRIGTLFLDENMEVRRFTPEVARIFRITGNDVGRPVRHLAHSIGNMDPFPVIHDVEKTSQGRSTEVRTKDGSWFLMRVLPYHVGTGAVAGILMTFIDIGPLKRTEEALSDSSARMQSIFRAAPVGVGLVVNSIIAEVSDRMCSMVGYRREELAGKSSRILYEDDEKYEAAGKEESRQIHDLGTGTVETRWRKKDGSVFPVLLSSSPLDPDDMSRGVTFTVLDISNSVRAQQQAVRSREMLAGTLDALTSHIAILDERGVIIAVNGAWRRFALHNAGTLKGLAEGVNYLAVCGNARAGEDSETASAFAEGILSVMKGDCEEFSTEYPCHSPDERRWFIGRVTRFRVDQDVYVVVAHENITLRVLPDKEPSAEDDNHAVQYRHSAECVSAVGNPA